MMLPKSSNSSSSSTNHVQWRKPTLLKLLLCIAPLSLIHILSIGNEVLALQTSSSISHHVRVHHHRRMTNVCYSSVSSGKCAASSPPSSSWRRNAQIERLHSSRSTTTSTDVEVWEKVDNQQSKKSTSSPHSSVQNKQQTHSSKTRKALQYLQSLTLASFYGAREAIRQSWYLYPMTLALIPVYCFFLGIKTTIPSWYYVVPLNHLTSSPYAIAVVGGFLLSNIFYFLSGLFMLDLIPLRRAASRRVRKFSRHLARDPLLGASVITAGLVSTIYHSVQTLGSYAMAQELCLIDTGVALSSSAYFLQKFGFPSWKTLVIGGAGILSWFNPLEGSYAGFHSLWHFFSASASLSWGFDGFQRRSLLKGKLQEG